MTQPVPAGQAADVWWYDTRAATLSPDRLAQLSGDEQARAGRLLLAVHRRRYQAAHLLLRQVLGGYLGAAPAELRFGCEPCPRCGGPSGRPVLTGPGAAPFPFFSLAHSADMVLIAVAGQPVGADTEQDPQRCVCSLAGSMHPADAAALAGLPEPQRHQAIIRWWVRAEAVLKCTGEGIAHRLGAFPVLNEAAAAGGCSLGPVPAPAGYQAALALASPASRPAVTLATPLPGDNLGL